MYGHPVAVRQSVRIAIHFLVNFELFKLLYLSKNLPDKHQTWGFCESQCALSGYVVKRLVPSPSRFGNRQWTNKFKKNSF